MLPGSSWEIPPLVAAIVAKATVTITGLAAAWSYSLIVCQLPWALIPCSRYCDRAAASSPYMNATSFPTALFLLTTHVSTYTLIVTQKNHNMATSLLSYCVFIPTINIPLCSASVKSKPQLLFICLRPIQACNVNKWCFALTFAALADLGDPCGWLDLLPYATRPQLAARLHNCETSATYLSL